MGFMKSRIPEAIFFDILEAREKVIKRLTKHEKKDEHESFGVQALAAGNITEEFVDPGTVNTQVNIKWSNVQKCRFHTRQSWMVGWLVNIK